MLVSSLACAAAQDEPAAKADAPLVGRSTATARVKAPGDSQCPVADRNKTANVTMDGCTSGACNSARQSSIAKLRGQVATTCDNFIRADSQCVKTGC
ncbi:MAG TPA: hypothetical protein VGC55_12910 [Dokdonella sp.]